jgi:hypothetical protein
VRLRYTPAPADSKPVQTETAKPSEVETPATPPSPDETKLRTKGENQLVRSNFNERVRIVASP